MTQNICLKNLNSQNEDEIECSNWNSKNFNDSNFENNEKNNRFTVVDAKEENCEKLQIKQPNFIQEQNIQSNQGKIKINKINSISINNLLQF